MSPICIYELQSVCETETHGVTKTGISGANTNIICEGLFEVRAPKRVVVCINSLAHNANQANVHEWPTLLKLVFCFSIRCTLRLSLLPLKYA